MTTISAKTMTKALGETTLTDQEIQSSHLAHYDLGPGYPQIELPQYVHGLYADDQLEYLSLLFPPQWTTQKQKLVDSDLKRSLMTFLGIGHGPDAFIHPTFSGSIALDRVVSAACRIARSRKYKSLRVVTTTPCIDIMRHFLDEHVDVHQEFVPSRKHYLGGLDIDAFIYTLNSGGKYAFNRLDVVLITSPENPTGEYWTPNDLSCLMKECHRRGALLLVDHTFLISGIQSYSDVPRVWDFHQCNCDWIAVWDTGKTFGLNEDKLGFIISGNVEMAGAVNAALNVLQFGVSRRQKLFFTELLRLAYYSDYSECLAAICKANLKCLSDTFQETSISVRSPKAGTLALLDIKNANCSDEEARQRLLSQGIGVVAARVFFHTKWQPKNLIRIALARKPVYFQDAITAIRKNLCNE